MNIDSKLLATEIAYRKSLGYELLSVAEFGARFKVLGYKVDRTMDCRAPARYLTGERAGRSYPNCNTGLKEADTGLSAFHYQARRDDRFDAMQRLRNEVFAVSRGAILEV
jgi:hypothetical protein